MNSTHEENALDIVLLGREYRVACKPEDRETLLKALSYVDEKMQEIADKTKASGERLAVMVALNIAHELTTLNAPGGFDFLEFKRRIASMQARLDAAMASQEQLF